MKRHSSDFLQALHSCILTGKANSQNDFLSGRAFLDPKLIPLEKNHWETQIPKRSHLIKATDLFKRKYLFDYGHREEISDSVKVLIMVSKSVVLFYGPLDIEDNHV